MLPADSKRRALIYVNFLNLRASTCPYAPATLNITQPGRMSTKKG